MKGEGGRGHAEHHVEDGDEEVPLGGAGGGWAEGEVRGSGPGEGGQLGGVVAGGAEHLNN